MKREHEKKKNAVTCLERKWWIVNGGIKSPGRVFVVPTKKGDFTAGKGRLGERPSFYTVAEARVAFRQKEGACRSGYVDRKWSVAPRRQLLHGHPYQLFHT